MKELRQAAAWVAGHYGHAAAYHAVRAPLYTSKLVAQAPRGTVRIIGDVCRWTQDAEAQPLRAHAVTKADAELYLKLSRQRDGRVRLRTLVAVACSTFGAGFVFMLYLLGPDWVFYGLLSASMLALGFAGAPADEPVISRAVVAPKVRKLTSDIVLRALGSLAIAQINQAVSKGSDALDFTAPITRDGPGWRAEGDLPAGVTVADVMERRDKLTAALRRPLGCVWPESVPEEHPGHLVLWVGDQDMNKARQPAWPLAKSGQVDLFKPAPFATDQRGRWVELTLMYIAGIIGAIPRMGKTFLLRLLLLIAALDRALSCTPSTSSAPATLTRSAACLPARRG